MGRLPGLLGLVFDQVKGANLGDVQSLFNQCPSLFAVPALTAGTLSELCAVASALFPLLLAFLLNSTLGRMPNVWQRLKLAFCPGTSAPQQLRRFSDVANLATPPAHPAWRNSSPKATSLAQVSPRKLT